jgi:2-dehydropantoate 2-reductase
MGGAWAGRLASAGADVAVVDVSPELVGAFDSAGISVETAAGEEVVGAVRAATDIGLVREREIVFVFVKGPHTRAATQGLAKVLDPETIVVSLQNGWGNADVIAETVDAGRIVVGVTYEGATVLSPGRISNPGHGPTHLGPYLEGGDHVAADRVAATMSLAGFECHVSATVRTDIWRKLIHNASCLAVAGLTDLRTSELVEPGDVGGLIDAIALEATHVAIAEGHEIDATERIEAIHRVLGSSGMGIASMLADVHARRPTEIDTINGAVVRAAARHGLRVPLNEAVVALIRGLERSWQRGV